MNNLESVVGEDVNLTPTESPEATPEVEQSETTPEAAEQAQEQHPEPKTVPLPALHEERAKRRELQQQLQQERGAREEMERRMQARLDQIAQAVTPKPVVPDFAENPAEHLKHSVEELRQATQASQRQLSEWQQRQAAEAQLAAVAEKVWAAEAEFVQDAPDYQSAVTFMLDSRARELEAIGHDSQSARNMAAREMMDGALMNAAQGRNPAEIAYKLAKARGYTAQASAADKMQMQQRGAAASKSLGTGGAASGKLSARALAEMSDEDFADATKGGNWQKLMGG